jgi:hypothetical protein
MIGGKTVGSASPQIRRRALLGAGALSLAPRLCLFINILIAHELCCRRSHTPDAISPAANRVEALAGGGVMIIFVKQIMIFDKINHNIAFNLIQFNMFKLRKFVAWLPQRV